MKEWITALAMFSLAVAPASAKQVYKCSNAGRISYQETPCVSEQQMESLRTYVAPKPGAMSTSSTFSFEEPAPSRTPRRAMPAPAASTSTSAAVDRDPAPTGYVRCIRPNGHSTIREGDMCPERRELIEHTAGMVTDVTTGQERFMVPGGGNGMIDPTTGVRHELISPQPTRRVRDSVQAVSADQACAEERAKRDRALSDFHRTMASMAAAKKRYEQLCGTR